MQRLPVVLLAALIAANMTGCQNQVPDSNPSGKISKNTERTEERQKETKEQRKETENSFDKPPVMTLSDPLSSQFSSFEVEPDGTYEWSSENQEGIAACGAHPLEQAEKPFLEIPDYNGMERVTYMVSFPVMPDKIRLTEWTYDAEGNPDADCTYEKEYADCEEGIMVELKKKRIILLYVIWDAEKEGERKFSGNAEYVFRT